MQSISWDWFGSGVNHNRLNSGQWGTLWPAAAPSCWRRQAWHELNAYPEKCHMAKSDLPHTKLHIRVIWLNWFTTNDSVYRVFQIPLLNRLKFETFFLSAISIWTLPKFTAIANEHSITCCLQISTAPSGRPNMWGLVQMIFENIDHDLHWNNWALTSCN